MRPAQPVPDALRGRVFTRADALDVVTRGRLAGPSYRRLTRGVYCGADLNVSERQRIEAFRAALPTQAVLGGLSAALALGSPWRWPAHDVEVLLPHECRVRPRLGLTIRGEHLTPDEIVATSLGRATSPARTAYDLARRAPGTRPWQLAEAVAWVDAVLHATGTGIDDVRAVLAAHRGARGSRVAALVIDLADPRAESPPESRLRVRVVLAGLPPPVPQYPVCDPLTGEVIYRLDLAWPGLRCAAEYDGQQHRLDDRQYRWDVERLNSLSGYWTIRRVLAEHMRTMPRLLADIERMLSRGGDVSGVNGAA